MESQAGGHCQTRPAGPTVLQIASDPDVRGPSPLSLPRADGTSRWESFLDLLRRWGAVSVENLAQDIEDAFRSLHSFEAAEQQECGTEAHDRLVRLTKLHAALAYLFYEARYSSVDAKDWFEPHLEIARRIIRHFRPQEPRVNHGIYISKEDRVWLELEVLRRRNESLRNLKGGRLLNSEPRRLFPRQTDPIAEAASDRFQHAVDTSAMGSERPLVQTMAARESAGLPLTP